MSLSTITLTKVPNAMKRSALVHLDALYHGEASMDYQQIMATVNVVMQRDTSKSKGGVFIMPFFAELDPQLSGLKAIVLETYVKSRGAICTQGALMSTANGLDVARDVARKAYDLQKSLYTHLVIIHPTVTDVNSILPRAHGAQYAAKETLHYVLTKPIAGPYKKDLVSVLENSQTTFL